MEFRELTDEQWAFLPRLGPGGPGPMIARYVLITGCRWQDMPRR